MSYYAASYRYGIASDSNSRLIRNVYRFATRQARDAWVAASPTEYSTQNGYRRSQTAGSIRYELRQERLDNGRGYDSDHVKDGDREVAVRNAHLESLAASR
jgi:hypothetical protein